MKKFIAKKGNTSICFKSEEDAKNYCAEHPEYNYEFRREWEYYDSEMRNSTTRYSRFSGNNLIDAIEQNFPQIMKTTRLYGASGYTLKSVKLQKINGATELIIESWPFSNALVGYSPKMCNKENLRKESIEIHGVENDEFVDHEYSFEIKKN